MRLLVVLVGVAVAASSVIPVALQHCIAVSCAYGVTNCGGSCGNPWGPVPLGLLVIGLVIGVAGFAIRGPAKPTGQPPMAVPK